MPFEAVGAVGVPVNAGLILLFCTNAVVASCVVFVKSEAVGAVGAVGIVGIRGIRKGAAEAIMDSAGALSQQGMSIIIIYNMVSFYVGLGTILEH